jgi:hypothetical protein
MSKRSVLVVALAWLSVPSFAAAQGPPQGPEPARRSVGVLFRLGLDHGGEELVELSYSDGRSSSIRAGQLVTFSGGILYQPAAPWSLEATIGYKVDRESASNGSVQFARIPVDVVLSYASQGHRVGAGLTAHVSPSLSCEGTVCGGAAVSVPLDTSFGMIAQYAHGFRRGDRGFEIGVRYTRISYAGDGIPAFDGSSIGAFFGAWL